jgi:DNA replication protein DnaC
MLREPSYTEMLRFTKGQFENMTDEEQDRAVLECARALEQRGLELRWKRLCPPEYRNTISEQLPNVPKFEEVQKWQYGPTGLLLVGPTRRGKTRSIWKLLERLHFDEHREIIAFTPMDLKLAVMSAWQDVETAEDWIFDLHNVDVLFFDDLDTVKFTEAVEETIYDAFEFRPTHEKPVIATVNRTGRELATQMNANGRGAKIVERMREYCRIINFT